MIRICVSHIIARILLSFIFYYYYYHCYIKIIIIIIISIILYTRTIFVIIIINILETIQAGQTFDKFDVSAIPSSFLSSSDVLRDVYELISKLEHSLSAQRDIDSAFNYWCGIVGANMYDEVPYNTILSSVSNKKRKVGKLNWSEMLSNLWNDVCIAERSW